MVQVKIALYGALTATGVILVNWILDLHFISGFFSGWWLSGLFG
jgi:hypothetical protein